MFLAATLVSWVGEKHCARMWKGGNLWHPALVALPHAWWLTDSSWVALVSPLCSSDILWPYVDPTMLPLSAKACIVSILPVHISLIDWMTLEFSAIFQKLNSSAFLTVSARYRTVDFRFACDLWHNTHPFSGLFSGTTRVGWYQKGKTNLDFTEARDSEWQWHQLGRMQVCTSLQTDNHASTPPLSFL